MSGQFSIENLFRIRVVHLISSFYNYDDAGTACCVKSRPCDNMAAVYCRSSGESLLISPTSTEIYMI
jgi:hypothetical protein